MTNKALLDSAIKLVNQIFESEGIFETNNVLFTRAERWYNHTEITDVETLAAVIMYGDYDSSLRHKDICEIKEFFFPSIPLELCEFHIGEIEMALHDIDWG